MRLDPGRSGRLARLLLAGILLAAATLRIWYAAYGLDERRFWDERYNFENVERILETGSLRPAKVYYPSPLVSWPQAGLLAASEALHRATGSPAFAIRAERGFTPTAYLVCRLLSVAYGMASIWLLFLVARRMFDTEVALLATLALAFLPWHVHASGKFKPDALVVLTVLVAMLWSLEAVRARTLRTYALAGFGIALALSGKVTGGVIAVSLVAGTLAARDLDWPRRLKLVAAAGGVSLAAFLAMNPYGRWYLDFVSGLQRDYEMRAGWQEGSGPIPIEALRYLLSGYVHGPLVGALALVGAAVLGARLVTGRADGPNRAWWSMLLVFPIAFTAAYTVATPYFKGNNFLPMLPFTCMLAAWAGWRGWRAAGSRLGRRGGALAGGLLVAAAILLLAAPGFVYVYRSLVPSAIDVARREVVSERRAPPGRIYYLETGEEPQPIWEGRQEFTRRYLGFRSAELDALSSDAIERADGVIFPRHRLRGESGELYRELVERVDEVDRRVIGPVPFKVRGPAAVALLQRRQPGGRAEIVYQGRCQPGRNCFGFEVGGSAAPGTLVSLQVTVPTAAIDPRQTELGVSVDGLDLGTVRVGIRGIERSFLTERFRLEGSPIEVRLTDLEPRLLQRQLKFALYTWRESGS